MGVVVAIVAGAFLTFAAADEGRFRRVFGPALRNQSRVQHYLLRSRSPSDERFIRQARVLILGAGVLFLVVALSGVAAWLA
jgi:hypothetical protein